ncbi:hypothetical protein ABTO68_19795, partial [Acinetobacter baumannii]
MAGLHYTVNKSKGDFTMKKRSVLFSAVLSTALLFAGCSGGGTEAGGSSAAPKKEGNNVTIAVNANFISLDPHNTGDTLS